MSDVASNMPATGWSPPTLAQMRAADQYVQILTHSLANEKGVHALTAIAGAARMAGTFLLRSFDVPMKDLEPGSTVLFEPINEHGSLLFNSLQMVLLSFQITLDKSRITGCISPENRPHLTVIETQSLVEAQFRKVSNVFELTSEQSAHACALAAGRLICVANTILDPHVGFEVAGMGFVEGSKTVPIPLTEDNSAEGTWHFFDSPVQSPQRVRPTAWTRFWDWFK
jgi:hypothetical protein